MSISSQKALGHVPHPPRPAFLFTLLALRNEGSVEESVERGYEGILGR
jgi:hypothetical protein